MYTCSNVGKKINGYIIYFVSSFKIVLIFFLFKGLFVNMVYNVHTGLRKNGCDFIGVIPPYLKKKYIIATFAIYHNNVYKG